MAVISERGERRREALVAAAASLLRSEGFDGVRHRAVAERAGLPLASTTYYFEGRDELLAEALARLATEQVTAARVVVESMPRRAASPRRAAAAVVAVVGGDCDRAELLALYERFVQAGREPTLAPLVRDWNRQVTELVTEVLRRCRRNGDLAPLCVALVDGLLIGALAEGKPDPSAVARDGLATFLT